MTSDLFPDGLHQQLSIFSLTSDAGSSQAPSEPPVKAVPTPEDQLRLARGGELVPDDEYSLARVVHSHSVVWKDYFVLRYADIVSTAMTPKHECWWLDLQCGTGRLYEVGGSYHQSIAMRVLDLPRPFHGYFYNDLDGDCISALTPRVARPDRNTHVRNDDVNSQALLDAIFATVPRSALVTVYADQQGIDMNVDVLVALARRYPKLDVLINFPATGYARAMHGAHGLAQGAGTAPNFSKAGRGLNHTSPEALFGWDAAETRRRVRAQFEQELAREGLDQVETKPVRLHRTNAVIYDLVLASRNPFAAKFFREATAREPSGQRVMDLGL